MKALITRTHGSRLFGGHGLEYFFALAGLAWVFCGALVLGLSVGAMSEIVACLAMSFGVMFLGLSALLGQLRTLNTTWRSAQFSWRSSQFSSAPPPVPVVYSIPIEEAIDDVRTTLRLAQRQSWIRSFDASRTAMLANNVDNVVHPDIAYPPPAIYFAGTPLNPMPASATFSDDGVEYYVEQPATQSQAPGGRSYWPPE